VEKYVGARQGTSDNIIWCMCVVCCVPWATDTHTHSKCVTLLVFPWFFFLVSKGANFILRGNL